MGEPAMSFRVFQLLQELFRPRRQQTEDAEMMEHVPGSVMSDHELGQELGSLSTSPLLGGADDSAPHD
jgi:hypothetical protein